MLDFARSAELPPEDAFSTVKAHHRWGPRQYNPRSFHPSNVRPGLALGSVGACRPYSHDRAESESVAHRWCMRPASLSTSSARPLLGVCAFWSTNRSPATDQQPLSKDSQGPQADRDRLRRTSLLQVLADSILVGGAGLSADVHRPGTPPYRPPAHPPRTGVGRCRVLAKQEPKRPRATGARCAG